MRTALLLGVASSLLLAGCGTPAGIPMNAPQGTPRAGQSLALPPAKTPAPLQARAVEITRLEEAGRIVADRVILKFTDSATAAERDALLDRHGLTVQLTEPLLGYGAYQVAGDRSLRSVLEGLWSEPLIVSAEPDFYLQATAVIAVRPADPRFPEQVNLRQIRVPEAWYIHPGDATDPAIGPTIPAVSDVTVAVLDTGFDFRHNDLNLTPNGDPRGDNNKVYGGIDLVNGDSNASDDNGHGTLIAGIIGALTHTAQGGFAFGISSVSWNARLMPVKVLDENGVGTTFNSARGILHAVQTWQAARGNAPAPPFVTGQNNSIFRQPFNARLVINMSYATEVPNAFGAPQMERDAVTYAVNNGALLVAAAGDMGKPVDDGFSTAFPAGHDFVIAVGAVDEINQVLTTSNRPKSTVPLADQRFLVAPGVNVPGTLPVALGEYGVGHGTSVAAAQVSGVLALMWSYYPLLLNEDGAVPTLLETANADIVGIPGIDNTSGHGLLDALGALNGVFEPRPTNDPMIVRAFTDPLLHNLVHFVVLSKYRLMDPTEIPFFINGAGDIELINNGAAFSYEIGIDANGNGTLEAAELLPLDGAFFPNEIVIGQLDDATYTGRIFFVQGPPPLPACPAGTLLSPPPPTGDLIINVTGVPEDFRIDETLPKTVSASTTLTLTDFANS